MPVKVVSDGPVKTYRVTCSKCFYELEYTPLDVMHQYVKDYGGGGDDYYWINCPRTECQQKIPVKQGRYV